MELLLFKFFGFMVVGTFVWFGLQMKRPKDSLTLVSALPLVTMKTMAISLVLALCYALISVGQVTAIDVLALIICAVGSAVVMSAQRALKRAQAFTWTGYALKQPRLVTEGIYSFVRHPLYLGVYLMEIGASIFVFPKMPMSLIPFFVAALVFAISFNAVLAGKESRYLMTVFGDEYTRYAEKVPAIIPKI